MKDPTACPTNTQWYRCSNGFAGCCSVDACHRGWCPNARGDDSSTSSSTTKSSSTATTSSTSTSTSTATMPPDDPTPSRVFAPIPTDDARSTMSSPSSKPPPRPSSSSSSSPSSPLSPPPSSTSAPRTDSGVTRTIPNDSTVTVTRHTTITQELPSTTSDPTASFTTAAAQDPTSSSSLATSPPPAATSAANTANQQQQPSSGVINAGVVVGIAVSGVFAVALVLILLWLWRSRRRRRAVKQVEAENGNEALFLDKASLHENIFGRRRRSATLPRHPTPPRQGYGYDPFAPFGGRADQPARTTSPPPLPNTFEMDGRGIQAVELPGTAVTTPNDVAVENSQQQQQAARSARPVKHRPSSDPRATLNHLPRENGRPTYINQWNQYKALAGETDTR